MRTNRPYRVGTKRKLAWRAASFPDGVPLRKGRMRERARSLFQFLLFGKGNTEGRRGTLGEGNGINKRPQGQRCSLARPPPLLRLFFSLAFLSGLPRSVAGTAALNRSRPRRRRVPCPRQSGAFLFATASLFRRRRQQWSAAVVRPFRMPGIGANIKTERPTVAS